MSKMDRKIKKAFDHATPDVLDSILSQCKEQKGTVIKVKKKTAFSKIVNIAAAAAVVVLLFGVGVLAASLMFPEGNHSLAQPSGTDEIPTTDASKNTVYTAPTDPDSTSPTGVHYHKLFAFTPEEAKEIAKRIISTSFPSYDAGNITPEIQCTYENAEPGLSGIYHIVLTYGADEFTLGIDEFTGCLRGFDTTAMEDAQPQELWLLTKIKIWEAVCPELNKSLQPDSEITIEGVADLEMQLNLSDDCFEVSFRLNGMSYDATVDAFSGEIISSNFDYEIPLISYDKAYEIIMSNFDCPKDHIFMTGMEIPEGNNPVWTLQFECPCQTHVCRIDAETGKVLSKSSNLIVKDKIGMITVNQYAATDAGLIQQFRNEELEFHTELIAPITGETPHYVVQFEYDGVGYYYVIDAVTGEIISRKPLDPVPPTGIFPEYGAIQTAMHKVGCPLDYARRLTCERIDTDSPEPFYLIYFEYRDNHYKFEISAYSGEILNYYSSLSEYPNAQIPEEIEDAIRLKYAQQHTECALDSVTVEYYGQYGDVYVAFVNCWCDIPQVETTEMIGVFDFRYTDAQTLDAYRDGELISLAQAYERGWFTGDTLAQLHAFYMSQKPYMYDENVEAPPTTPITDEQAIQICADYVGASVEEIEVLLICREGEAYYNLRIRFKGTIYEFWIDAKSQEILNVKNPDPTNG